MNVVSINNIKSQNFNGNISNKLVKVGKSVLNRIDKPETKYHLKVQLLGNAALNLGAMQAGVFGPRAIIVNKLVIDTVERFVAVCFGKHMGFSTQCTNVFSNLDSALRLLIRKIKK